MRIGLAGLKNSGKSTLFETLIGHVTTGFDRPGEMRQGVMTVIDDRVDFLEKCYSSKKKVYPSFELIDLPPLETVKSADGSISAKVLEEYKKCDALIQVLRHFENPAVPVEGGSINPARDKSSLDTELILTDLTIIENRLDRINKMKGKQKDFSNPNEPEILKKCKEALENEIPLHSLELNRDEEKVLKSFQFLSLKPTIAIVNIGENDIGSEEAIIKQVQNGMPSQNIAVEVICCQAEKEILELSEEERNEFREGLGIERSAVSRVSDILTESMNLIRFLTGGPTESRSWVIPAATPAPAAGGTIHSDIEKGFIRVEVIKYEDLLEHKSEAKCKEKGLYRLEGKEYLMQDGDVVYFRFNV